MATELSPLTKRLRGTIKRFGKHGLAALGGALAVSGAIGLWSLAVAQQPYPSPYPPPGYQQPPGPPPGYERAYPRPGQGTQPSPQQLRCIQLEQELSNDWVHRQQGLDDGPNIEAQISKYDRIFQQSQARAERQGCYRSNFIFGRSLVRSPRCLRLNRQIEDARRQLEILQSQRQARSGGSSRRRDELIAALARAGCGSQYQRQAGRRGGGGFLSWLEEGFWDTRPQGGLETTRIEQFATYRTLCVRSCDGYYFPVSYSTLPSNFPTDAQKCQSQCAAPAELFVYRNPGEQAEQMVSSDGRNAYADHQNAWRYRKEFVKGCSCKQAEYDPNEIALVNQKAEEAQAEKAAQAQGGASTTDSPTPPQQNQ